MIAVVQEGRHFSQIAFGLPGAFHEVRDHIRQQFTFSVYQLVSLFCDSKTCHLQRRVCKNRFQTSVLFLVGTVQDQGFHNASHHGFCHRAICLQRSKNGKVIMGPVHLFNDFIVVALHRN